MSDTGPSPFLLRRRHTPRLASACLARRFDQVLARCATDRPCTYRADGPAWSLSDGQPVTGEVATLLINSKQIIPAGCSSLFPNLVPGQVWEIFK